MRDLWCRTGADTAFKRSLLFLLDLDPAIWGAGGEYRAVAAPRANYKNTIPDENVAHIYSSLKIGTSGSSGVKLQRGNVTAVAEN